MEGDYFRLLNTGVRFNKKRFQNDVKLFEIAHFRHLHRIHIHGMDVPPPMRTFDDLDKLYDPIPLYMHRCPATVMRALNDLGYTNPTPIQMQAIPIFLQGKDLFACAPTGSGKTLAFMLPMVMRLLRSSSVQGVLRGIVISPTRELAQQIARHAEKLCAHTPLRTRLLTHRNEETVPHAPTDILITTPMRMARLVKQGNIKLDMVEMLVLDEADKLFDMGFLEQVDEIFAACTRNDLVRALFSATLPQTVEETARTVMHDPLRIVIGSRHSATDIVKQRLLYVGNEAGKMPALRRLISEGIQPPVIVFVQSVDRAKDLYQELVSGDISVDMIHSERTEQERDAAVRRFRLGETFILIATDLLARGMDFKGVRCVVNFDFPQSTVSYIHRIGRTGRAGRPGEAITFFTDQDTELLRSVANVVRESGGEVPEWMLKLRKIRRDRKHELAVRPIRRKPIKQRPRKHVIVPGAPPADSGEEDEQDDEDVSGESGEGSEEEEEEEETREKGEWEDMLIDHGGSDDNIDSDEEIDSDEAGPIEMPKARHTSLKGKLAPQQGRQKRGREAAQATAKSQKSQKTSKASKKTKKKGEVPPPARKQRRRQIESDDDEEIPSDFE